ncbi:MAG: hypothetical protein AB1568_17700 [Thermodesulfobacteriota bacterium]
MDRRETGIEPSAVVMSVLAMTGVAILDYLTGYRFGFFVFYFLPVAYCAWKSCRRVAYLLAILSALAWFAVDRWSGDPHSIFPYGYWNAGIRLLSFLTIAHGVSRIRELLRLEQHLRCELQEALAEVRTLTGFLPICARCKKIRDDGGYWRRLEEYIEQRTPARFTHGYCERCANQLLADAGLPPKFTEQPAAADDDPH